MKRGVKVKQHDITDCGAACLASISAYFGLRFPIARIRQFASTDQQGTNVLGMIQAAQKLGLDAKGVKGNFEALKDAPFPIIAHVKVNDGNLLHFIVIYKHYKKHLLVMDPAVGKLEKMTHDHFQEIWSGIIILVNKSERFVEGNRKQSVYYRFWFLLKPHKTVLLQAIFAALFFSILGLATSIYVEKLVDFVFVDGNVRLLNLMSIIMLFVLVLRFYFGYIKSYFLTHTGQKIDVVLMNSYYKHLMHLPQQFFDSMQTGEIISRINDAAKIRNFINNVLLELLVNVMILVFSISLMFVYSWKLSLLSLICVPGFIGIYYWMNKSNKKHLRKVMESSAEMESQLFESINTLSTVKKFRLENLTATKTEVKFVKVLNNVFSVQMVNIFSGNAIGFISGLTTLVILWVGTIFVLNLEMTSGELMSFYSVLGYTIGPIVGLITINQTVQDALIASDRLFQILDLESEVNDGKIELKSEMISEIKFEHVCFSYGSRQQVFNDLNFQINKNELIAIVGESGSGKTTITSLLMHIYAPNSGKIEIGGVDLNHFSNESIRKMIGIVPQKIELFSGTLLENLILDDEDPSMTKLMRLFQQLNLVDFLKKLPDGFYTKVSENGTNFSAGEKQRLAIARTLYYNPEVIIFDEPTSSLDSKSETIVMNTILKLKEIGKTVIIITHKYHKLEFMDKIIVLRNGEIVEFGTHDSLMSSKGEFYLLNKN